MFLGLLDPDSASDPDPLSSSKNSKKTLIPIALLLLFDFLSLKNDVNVPSKNFFKIVFCWRLKGQ